jgi:hypothetical protein
MNGFEGTAQFIKQNTPDKELMVDAIRWLLEIRELLVPRLAADSEFDFVVSTRFATMAGNEGEDDIPGCSVIFRWDEDDEKRGFFFHVKDDKIVMFTIIDNDTPELTTSVN